MAREVESLQVVDLANVVAAALTSRYEDSPTTTILKLLRNGQIKFMFSVHMMQECRGVLLREKLQRRHRKTAEDIDGLIAEIAMRGTLDRPSIGPAEGPDPKDSYLWQLLRLDPRAVLITGDRALVQKPPEWAQGRVLTPREWLDQILASH